MNRVIKIGSAFIGIIVGAGFASGQEILQYFTSFGHLGTVGAFVSMALFAYLGMTLTKLGSRLQTDSHKDAIYTISGRYLGFIVDIVIIFTLFSVGVVMIAGAGSTFHQQFGLPSFVGSLLMVILVIVVMMLKVDKVITIIGSISPFLILTIVIISIYSIATKDLSYNELHPIAQEHETSLQNWFIAAINYASFNIAVGAGMSLVMGGAEKNERIAAIGGFIGGIGIGVLILLAHLAVFSKVDTVAAYDLPLLAIVEEISPLLAVFMSIILFGMIFNTGVSMFYAFVARFFDMNKKSTNIPIIVTVLVGFAASFVGFTKLVEQLYPVIGFLGLFLVIALIYAPFKLKKESSVKR